MSQFASWFKSQFGNTPTDLRAQHEILSDIATAKAKVSELERELFEYRRIHFSWEAAVYSKNASEKKYGF